MKNALPCMLLCALGCGGGASEARPPASASPGLEDESATETAAEPSAPSANAESATNAEPAPKAGPASLSLEAKVHGKSVPANVRLLSADGNEVASGPAGQAIQLPSGEYTLEVQVNDAAAMLDTPTQRRQLTIHGGDALQEVAEFPWAMIQLNVRVNGALDRKAEVLLMRDGEQVAKVHSGAEPTAITPGRYEATVLTRGAKIEVKGMQFPEGGTAVKPVDVHM
jgi:hypothetical protein